MTMHGGPILRLLGGALIEADGGLLGGPAAHKHRLALLTLLAVSRQPVSRDKLMAYLWPERDTEAARRLLRTALYEIGKLLGKDVVRRTGDTLSIDSSLLRCDVLEFEAAVAANDLEGAAALYSGPFLDGFFMKESSEFEEWVSAERARLAQIHERVLAQRGGIAVPRPVRALPADTRVGNATAVSATPPRRKLRPAYAFLALVVVVVAVATVRYPWSKPEPAPQPVLLPDGARGSALMFDGASGGASTLPGTLATRGVDNVGVDMLLRWEGPGADPIQVIFYNGNPQFSGWGILVLGPGDGQVDGTLAFRAAGYHFVATPLVLTRGRWQRVSAERRNGSVTVTLDGQSFAVGPTIARAVGVINPDLERTAVGGLVTTKPIQTFHGAIDMLRIRDLLTSGWVERWPFDDGKGQLAVGASGAVLHFDGPRWVEGAELTAQYFFWFRMERHCAAAFRGRSGDSVAVLYVYSCTPNEIRFAVHVGADRSRNFVLARDGAALRLRAERYAADGTEDKRFRLDAVTETAGSTRAQDFLGATAGDIARLELDPKKTFSITLERGKRAPERMTFDLGVQVATPPLPRGLSAPDQEGRTDLRR